MALGEVNQVRESGIGQGDAGRVGHGSRQVGDGGVDDAVFYVCWAVVGAGLGDGEAAALVNGDIHRHAPGLHGFDVCFCRHNRRFLAGDINRTDEEVRIRQEFL